MENSNPAVGALSPNAEPLDIREDTNLVEKQGIFFGWIVVAGAFLITATTCGAFYSFGVFFLPVMNEFGWSRGLTSGVNFASGIAYGLTVPLTGLLADRYGFRLVTVITISILGLGFFLGSQVHTAWQLYLFIGFFPGLGACAAFALPLAMVTRWFIRRQGLALGIASAGVGAGGALVPLIVTWLISAYGWRVAFGFLGLLVWIVCVPACLVAMRNPDTAKIRTHEGGESDLSASSNPGDEAHEFTLMEAIRTAPFWILFSVFALCIFCLGLTLTHLVPYAQDTGLSAIAAAGLLSVIGTCSITGRISSGMISDRIGARPVLFVCMTLQGLMMLWLIRADVLWMFYLFSALFGVAYGGNLVLIPKMTSSIFGVKSMGAIFGGLSVADGMGFATGPLLAGYIFDVTGSYDISFAIVIGGMVVALLLTVILKERAAIK